ncbi:2,3-diaminopropionate biosynthesis protein SbnB, partial [Amycolatopsis sp. NPDC000740]
SVISAKRTAASAALAARTLSGGTRPDGVAMIGCGVVNFEVLRFLVAVWRDLRAVTVYDRDRARAEKFAMQAKEFAGHADIAVAVDTDQALGAHELISIATTASEPHLGLRATRPGSLVLHVSLRDIYPDSILANQNVVDDAEHVCRERTSLDLAQRLTYRRDFIDASIGQLLRGIAAVDRDPNRRLVFSPFGLGALDIAVAEHVRELATQAGAGLRMDDFLPKPA